MLSVFQIYNSTKRKPLERMIDNKVSCMKEAKKYSKNYWTEIENLDMGDTNIYLEDGKVAQKLIKYYKLKSGSKFWM